MLTLAIKENAFFPSNHFSKRLADEPSCGKVRAGKNGVLLLAFSNGEERQFSVLPYLDYPVYHSLKNEGVFEEVSVFNGTVCWGLTGRLILTRTPCTWRASRWGCWPGVRAG
jgi:hypothetical protein